MEDKRIELIGKGVNPHEILTCSWCGETSHEDDFYSHKHCSVGCEEREEVF